MVYPLLGHFDVSMATNFPHRGIQYRTEIIQHHLMQARAQAQRICALPFSGN